MSCTEECFLPSHLPGAGSPQASGAPAPSTPCLQSSCEVSRAAVPPGQGEKGADRRGNSCEEHRAGINHAGKVPKRAGVPGVPALAGIEQHGPIVTECENLHLNHSFPI